MNASPLLYRNKPKKNGAQSKPTVKNKHNCRDVLQPYAPVCFFCFVLFCALFPHYNGLSSFPLDEFVTFRFLNRKRVATALPLLPLPSPEQSTPRTVLQPGVLGRVMRSALGSGAEGLPTHRLERKATRAAPGPRQALPHGAEPSAANSPFFPVARGGREQGRPCQPRSVSTAQRQFPPGRLLPPPPRFAPSPGSFRPPFASPFPAI